jgi:DnaK suppressor protein
VVKKTIEKHDEFGHIKQELLDRKREYEEELTRLYGEKFADEVQDPGDQALASTMEALSSSLQDTKVAEYHRIVKALAMIDSGQYGVCVDCHEPISEKRLKSYPDATRCIACQEIYEEKTQQEFVS